jgi:hypothetical protein
MDININITGTILVAPMPVPFNPLGDRLIPVVGLPLIT